MPAGRSYDTEFRGASFSSIAGGGGSVFETDAALGDLVCPYRVCGIYLPGPHREHFGAEAEERKLEEEVALHLIFRAGGGSPR